MPRKVLIGTPSYDGKLEAWYVNSLINAVLLGAQNGIRIIPVFLCYDALIQRARNDLISMAIENECESLLFIDSDMVFNPEWVIKLINSDKDVIGGTTRKKTDDYEGYSVKTRNIEINEDGLIQVDCVGTGFVKISREALQAVYDASDKYENEGKISRMVCDTQIIDGQLYSEDRVLSKKLNDAGYDVWLDPAMTCAHIGNKVYKGDFMSYIKRI